MFTLDQVVPWGRSFDEYCRMFALSDEDFEGTILGCADGPAGFNAEATALGHSVISSDPLYEWSSADIRARIEKTFDQVIAETKKNAREFVWDRIRSIDELGRVRRAAMDRFLADFEAGKAEGRYVSGELPRLPFRDNSFDLAVCSHFLFLYSKHLTAEFHIESALELCRVAREIRMFPLLALGGAPSPHIGQVSDALIERGYSVAIERVDYEFQRGGNQMMRIGAWQRETDAPTSSASPSTGSGGRCSNDRRFRGDSHSEACDDSGK